MPACKTDVKPYMMMMMIITFDMDQVKSSFGDENCVCHDFASVEYCTIVFLLPGTASVNKKV